MTDIDLSTGAPASPERTLQLAEALAETARVLNHATMDRAAFGVPSDVDRVLREVASAAARFQQLFAQAARWVADEDGAGRIEVASGDPRAAVLALGARLTMAAGSAAALHTDLQRAAQVTWALAAAHPEDGAPEVTVWAWCKGCRQGTGSVPCPRCGAPACAGCGRCPPCDGPVPDGAGDG